MNAKSLVGDTVEEAFLLVAGLTMESLMLLFMDESAS